jgi:transcriptional regulator with XRE-family HTH domain
MSQEELERVGRRLRSLRLAAGLTQAELAGKRFSHAYVSVLEAGRREPSRAAVEYFAQRLGVSAEEIWSEKGASWALQMARDLRAEGLDAESRELLARTLTNLESDRELHSRVLVVLHRELAGIDLDSNPAGAKVHLEKALELAEADDSLAGERAVVMVLLGDLVAAEGANDDAARYYRTAIDDLLEVIGRRADVDANRARIP